MSLRFRLRWLVIASALAGCGAPGARVASAADPARAACPAHEHWDGAACRARGPGPESIERGAAALAAFRVDDALALLARAAEGGPHRHADHVRMHEQLGIAYAYLGDEDRALQAFDALLSLSPEHLLSYTLSPKATFVFERARAQALSRPRPALHLSWPYDLDVSSPVPIDIEVVADPRRFLRRAELHVRKKGEHRYAAIDLTLPEVGGHHRVVVPAPGTRQPEVLELYLTALDERGNEVLLWATPERPRELALFYEAPTPWYRTWWAWAAIGGALATTTGIGVYALLREPPDTVGGTLIIHR